MSKYEIALKSYINAYHVQLAQEEKAAGRKLYQTFGDWKTENPKHPLSKANYPLNEYIMVISAFRDYFNRNNYEELDI